MTGGSDTPVSRAQGAVTLFAGDAAEVLARLPESSVDCVMTSPPYWGLRDYRVEGQYGHEDTVEEYVAVLCRVFDQVARVLTRQGTVWLNLGDSFGGSWGNYVAPVANGRISPRAGWRQGMLRPPQSRHRAKDLVGTPWRVALALMDRGWLLRNPIVWAKPNARPESVRDRLSQRYEMVFALAWSDHWPNPSQDDDDGVWWIPSPRSSTTHIAAGSVELARRCITLGAKSGGVVLDPFSGSGTTGVAARMLGHPYIGIDIDPACHRTARHRIAELCRVDTDKDRL